MDMDIKHETPITKNEVTKLCGLLFEEETSTQWEHWSRKQDGKEGFINVDCCDVRVPISGGQTGQFARIVRCVAERPDIPLEANFFEAECAAEHQKWDPISTGARVIIDDHQGCDVMYGNFKVPMMPFFREREYVVYRRIVKVSSDKYFMLQRSAMSPKVKEAMPDKSCEWSECFMIAVSYERVGEGCKISICVLNDPGGNMPRSAFTAFAAMAVRQMFQKCGQCSRDAVKAGQLDYIKWWFKQRVINGKGELAIDNMKPPPEIDPESIPKGRHLCTGRESSDSDDSGDRKSVV